MADVNTTDPQRERLDAYTPAPDDKEYGGSLEARAARLAEALREILRSSGYACKDIAGAALAADTAEKETT